MNELAMAVNKQDHYLGDGVADGAYQYLTFSVLGKLMAIGILDVKEIIEVSSMTRVPMTQNSIRGVINLRGNVVPVVDLGARLGSHIIKLTKKSCIVLVSLAFHDETQTMGILVEQVNEILTIPEQNRQKPPDFGTDIDSKFISQIGRYEEDFVILLNKEKVLCVEELSEQIVAAQSSFCV
ncbi:MULTISPECIES: chemotaxis protein CheW [unclassified Motilimonas]|uniref:chemotaxis protein CheW n=1 Tax=Motilimonas TaxID=1914248 RepID=UPI001E2C3B78|nr:MULTISPECIES: chemotaxis protein CheW [unclassified Motilimonas]MCE0558845.1 chemotaxis protein CheW [Motilimonas sp. E26]MDO6526843.1 chemotaxis protein CheW [Motilimonas sp. 1_MG-2023]